MRRFLAVLPIIALSAGCYHATVETGLPASNQVVEKKWANSFLGGLVPPGEVDTKGKCPSGVARVETQLSFLNMLANAVTFGIYSPMTITATCAASRTSSLPSVTDDDPMRALAKAVELSVATGGPVDVVTH